MADVLTSLSLVGGGGGAEVVDSSVRVYLVLLAMRKTDTKHRCGKR